MRVNPQEALSFWNGWKVATNMVHTPIPFVSAETSKVWCHFMRLAAFYHGFGNQNYSILFISHCHTIPKIIQHHALPRNTMMVCCHPLLMPLICSTTPYSNVPPFHSNYEKWLHISLKSSISWTCEGHLCVPTWISLICVPFLALTADVFIKFEVTSTRWDIINAIHLSTSSKMSTIALLWLTIYTNFKKTPSTWFSYS